MATRSNEQIMSETAGGHIKPFDPNVDGVSAKWVTWKDRLSRWLDLKADNMADNKKLNWMLLLGGEALELGADVLDQFAHPAARVVAAGIADEEVADVLAVFELRL